jgi:hypothetical protein
MSLKNMADGMPDGGLFTADQFQRQAGGTLRTGQLPAPGAIEAKGTRSNVKSIASTVQVKDYLNTYGIVIVTNLSEFSSPQTSGSRSNRYRSDLQSSSCPLERKS